MRKTPRLGTLLLGLAVILVAIWRLATCSSAPLLTGLFPSAAVPASSAPASPSSAPRARSAAAPLRLPSGSAAADATTPLGALEGKVISSGSGEGLAGARVVLEREGAPIEVKTGADGAFVFVPPEAGTYAIVYALAEGHLPFEPAADRSPITWTARPGGSGAPARVRGFVLALDPEVTFEVHVASPSGEPVPDAEVRVLGPSRLDASRDAGKTFRTGPEGSARLPLAAGALVEARHPAHAPGRARVTLAAEASHELTVRLRPKDAPLFGGAVSSIRGRVVGPDGAPVAGARVVVTPEVENRATADAGLRTSGSGESDAEGGFHVDGLDEGTYEITASDGEHAPARATGVAAGATGVTLRLGAGGTIRGVVRTTSGAPVAAFSILVTLARGPLEREPVAARSFLDAEGRYEIEGLGPGEHEVVAAALDAAPSAPAKVTIPSPPGAPVDVDLTLSRGAVLRGAVLDRATGKPLAGARVSLEGPLAVADDVPLVATATTGDDGGFVLPGLAEGLRSLTVTAAGHHARVVSGIVVAGGDPPPITIELTPLKPGEEPGIELVGIGAVLSAKDDALVLGQVLPGGGAAEVGLAPGDAILGVDGVKVTELGFEGAVVKIRGPEGSVVVLTVRRSGATGAADIPVPRRRIKG